MAESNVSCTNTLSYIPDDISTNYLPECAKLSGNSLKKGLNYYTQGYVHKVEITREDSCIAVAARCWRSMGKSEPPHLIRLQIKSGSMVDACCTCKIGSNGHCSHIVGLLKTLQGFKLHGYKEVPDEQSCTSVPQQWHVPRGSKITPVPMNHVVVARPTESRKRKPVLCQIDSNYKLPKVTEPDIEKLTLLKGTPLERMNPTTPLTASILGDIPVGSMLSYQTRNIKQLQHTMQTCGDTRVTRPAPVLLPTEFQALNNEMPCKDPANMEEMTRSQSTSALWHSERQKRLTASTFGQVMCRKAAPTDKFVARLFSTSNVKAKSLDYGRKQEKIAKEAYLQKFPSRHLHECGFVVNNEFSFLGASPDGKLCDQGVCGLIEIKCPYSARQMDIQTACNTVKNFYLSKVGDSITLNTDHSYYSQVQGQLLITGCDFCDFVVFTQKDLFVQRITPDIPYMESMLRKLSVFYRDYGLPYLRNTKSC